MCIQIQLSTLCLSLKNLGYFFPSIIHGHDILIVPDLRSAIHNFPLVPRGTNEIQENRSLPDLCKIKECLSNMLT